MLAGDAVAGRTTRTFTREHGAYLSESAAKLTASTDARIARLARHVVGDLDRLGDASGAGQKAIAHNLEAVAKATE